MCINLYSGSQPRSFVADNEGRIYALQQACKHHGLDGITEETLCEGTSLRQSEYYIAQQKAINSNAVWCKVFKSASTR